jgi:hypothetical protein
MIMIGCRLTIGSSDHGVATPVGEEEVDDQNKASPFVAAHPRRSTSSLDLRAIFHDH